MTALDAQIGEMRRFISQSWMWLSANSLGIAIALAAAVALAVLLLAIRRFGCRILAGESRPLFAQVAGRVLGATQSWFIVVIAAELVADLAAPPPVVAGAIRTAFTIAAALQGAIWLRELVLAWVEQRAQVEGSDHGSLASALGIIKLLVSVAAFALAAILILDNLGVNVTALVAGLGIGGIAIGLAAQGIFSDLFAALSILFDKPFRKGDTIQWEQSTGTVEAIGLKTTRVRATTGERVVISNANLLGKELRNLERQERRRVTFKLSFAYNTPPDVLEGIPDLLKGVVAEQKKCVFISSSFVAFAPNSLDFELVFDVKGMSATDFTDARTRVAVAVLRAFGNRGLSLAAPPLTAFSAPQDGVFAVAPALAAAISANPPDGKS